MSQTTHSSAVNTYSIPATGWTVKQLPKRMQPREEVDRLGFRYVSDSTLLAILLRSGTAGHNVVELADAILRKYGSLTALSSASIEELTRDEQVKGLGKVKAQVLLAALEVGRRLQQEAIPERTRICTPEDAVRVLASDAAVLTREVFWALNLDTKNRLQGRPQEISQGILDASLVHPREVFREAIRSASAAVVLSHNHPSGDPTPSAEDIRITRQLVEAGRIVDIRVLDHIIIGAQRGTELPRFTSLRESGIVNFS
ncbi:MAG: DNA repair protein RadC [Verrucomicrobia bacterium]|nr:DNA repair protein RadC [Verrucomicrobiota bacterium]